MSEFNCKKCYYYQYSRMTEFAGEVGTCRYNPPYIDGFPEVKSTSWCGKGELKSLKVK